MAGVPFINNPASGDAARTALDFFGVDPSIVNDFVDPNAFVATNPRTRTRTSHGLTIKVAGSRLIGAVQSFRHSQTRNVEEVFEIQQNAHGYGPVDLIPQNVTTRSLDINRYDLWVRNIEEAFGVTELISLSDQSRPFTLRTTWQSPTGAVLAGRRVYEYQGCYFTNFGRAASVTDTRIIAVDANIVYRNRVRVL